jgi:quercetin dioxygenase-like cupin family protein
VHRGGARHRDGELAAVVGERRDARRHRLDESGVADDRLCLRHRAADGRVRHRPGLRPEAPAGSSTFAAASVHFTPGARTAWHTHPHRQTIFVTEGVGLCQREGGPIEEIRPGDRVFFEPGENHWHGAAPNRFMVHTPG